MSPFEPDFEMIKMDAEIGSYQEDFDPERGPAEASAGARDPAGDEEVDA